VSGGRPYTQTARAAATDATRDRIVEAAMELFLERWFDDVTLRDVAAAAGVALQTVVNHFGSKDGLFLACIDRFRENIEETRNRAEPDDVHGAVAVLVSDYEHMGDANVRALSVEDRIPAIAKALAEGRSFHRAWVERTFPGALAGLGRADRDRRLLALCAALDVMTWKLLRRDQGLSRARTAAVMQEMTAALYPNGRH
jgi:AcrR family transcriptional regulator